MKPNEYYKRMVSSITEADVRLVAACMTDYIGEANAVRIETLAGRWIATSEDDRWLVIGDLDSRIKSLRERREAMLTAKIPNALELNRQEARVMQTGLF